MVTEKAKEKLVANGVKDAEKIAETIGVGAMKFGDLSNEVNRDYLFDLDAFMSFEGKTGPYIQYTAVRIKSLLQKVRGDYNKQKS
jgi:arginyl-tRNA synthetase